MPETCRVRHSRSRSKWVGETDKVRQRCGKIDVSSLDLIQSTLFCTLVKKIITSYFKESKFWDAAPNFHFLHLHGTQIYTKPRFTRDPDLHNPRFTCDPDLHSPDLHKPIFAHRFQETQIYGRPAGPPNASRPSRPPAPAVEPNQPRHKRHTYICNLGSLHTILH